MDIKSGIKTSEFWLSVVAFLLGVFVASGVLPDTHPAVRIAGAALAALSQLGYAVSRGIAKGAGVLVLAFALLAMSACSPATQQLATCIAGKAAARCLPQCALCIKDVVSECKAAQPAATAPACTTR